MSGNAPAPDPTLLQEVLTAEGIHPDPAAPSRWSWFVDRVTTWVGGLFHDLERMPGMGELVWTIAALLSIALGLAALLALWRLVRVGRSVWRTRPAPVVLPVDTLDAPDASRFRGEAEGALAAGRPRDAIRAAWAWVAWTLHERAVVRYEPDLTNRELVDAVRRAAPWWGPLPSLRAFARRVDALCYDLVEPAVDDARALLGQAEALLVESTSETSRPGTPEGP